MKYCPKCRTRYPGEGACPRDQTPLEPDPLLGWVVARRRLDAVLGEGAQAVVYRATHVDLHREEVVKILKNRSGNLSPERFAREARALAGMSTEHVVQIHDYGQTADGEHFLVMERVVGESLGAALRDQGPLPLERALLIVEQLCLGLTEAHRLGIIHRDLKPDNVLLERRKGATERVKIVDFGIAHDRRVGLTLPGRIFGTPGYLAPEQLQGQALDARADLFAVGVLLYEMLAGFNPLAVEGTNPAELLTAVAHRLRTPLAPLSTVIHGLPPEVDAFVSSLVALERNDRPEDAAAVALRAAELRFTLAGRTSHPEIKALTDELREQADQLAAERAAIEGRMRALARREQALEAAHRRLLIDSAPPQPALLPHSPSPISHGPISHGPISHGPISHAPSPIYGLTYAEGSSLSGHGPAYRDPSGSGRPVGTTGSTTGSTTGRHPLPSWPTPPPAPAPRLAAPPAPSTRAGTVRTWSELILAVGVLGALTAALAVLLMVAFDQGGAQPGSQGASPPARPTLPASPGLPEAANPPEQGSLARR